jgi:hypothetical protein
MEFVIVILLTVGMILIAVTALAVRILFKKGGKFPNTHVSGNKHLRELGIYCAQTQDRIEQRKFKKEVDYKNVKFIKIPKND